MNWKNVVYNCWLNYQCVCLPFHKAIVVFLQMLWSWEYPVIIALASQESFYKLNWVHTKQLFRLISCLNWKLLSFVLYHSWNHLLTYSYTAEMNETTLFTKVLSREKWKFQASSIEEKDIKSKVPLSEVSQIIIILYEKAWLYVPSSALQTNHREPTWTGFIKHLYDPAWGKAGKWNKQNCSVQNIGRWNISDFQQQWWLQPITQFHESSVQKYPSTDDALGEEERKSFKFILIMDTPSG